MLDPRAFGQWALKRQQVNWGGSKSLFFRWRRIWTAQNGTGPFMPYIFFNTWNKAYFGTDALFPYFASVIVILCKSFNGLSFFDAYIFIVIAIIIYIVFKRVTWSIASPIQVVIKVSNLLKYPWLFRMLQASTQRCVIIFHLCRSILFSTPTYSTY